MAVAVAAAAAGSAGTADFNFNAMLALQNLSDHRDPKP